MKKLLKLLGLLLFMQTVPFTLEYFQTQVQAQNNPWQQFQLVGEAELKFFFWNVIGAILWTDGIIIAGYYLGEKLEGSVDKYLLPVVGLIILVSVLPVGIEFLREWRTRRHLS